MGANGLKVMASCTLTDELGLVDVNTTGAGTGHGVAGTEIGAVVSTRVGGGSFFV